MKLIRIKYILPILLLSILLDSVPSKAFSILAHEAVVDAVWDTGIKPLLNDKFPNLTKEQYKTAHAYAYGGSLMADMGYMPGGNAMFTDLLHYVRSGDFVTNLLNEAHTSQEYAFALGALSHYVADEYGHSLATNKTVPLIYPKLRKKFGNIVTYDDDNTSHSRVEFTYDVLQVGKGNYASNAYHDFVGFEMAVPLLEKVFRQTYGLELSTFFKNFNSSINTYRWDIRQVFPRMIRKAARGNKDEIERLSMTKTERKFNHEMRRHMFNIEYGKARHNRSFFPRLIASIIYGLPKIGPLKTLKFVNPTPKGEKLFDEAFKTITQKYSDILKQLDQHPANLPDIDFDTGKPTEPGEYHLTDETYGKMLLALQENHFANLSPELKENILSYYKSASPALFDEFKTKDLKKVVEALKELKNQPVATPLPTSTAN